MKRAIIILQSVLLVLVGCNKSQENLDPNHPASKDINGISEQGDNYMNRRDYQTALKYYQTASLKVKALRGEESPYYVRTLINVAYAEDHLGNYLKAEEIYLYALKVIGPKKKSQELLYAEICKRYGDLCSALDRYAEAEKLLQEALEYRKMHYSKDPLSYAKVLQSLGVNYQKIGLYEKAKLYFNACLKIVENYKSSFYIKIDENQKNDILITTYTDLSVLYYDTFDYDKAELMAMKAHVLLSNTHNYQYVVNLTHLARIYDYKGDSATCLDYYKEAVTWMEQNGLSKTIDYAQLLDILGGTYEKHQQYKEAEECYKQSLSIVKKLPTDSMQFYAVLLHNLGNFYAKMGDYAKAEQFTTEGAQLYKESYINSLEILSEKDLEERWHKIATAYKGTIPNIIYKIQDNYPQIGALAYNNELFSKGALPYSLNHMRNIKKKNNQYDIAPWEITWENVQNSLGDHEVAIEIMPVHIPTTTDSYSVQFDALILKKNSRYPEIVHLGSIEDLNNSSRIIWTPILPYLSKGDTVYFAPAEGLHILAIEYCPYSKNFLMSEVFTMVRLSSTRELAVRKKENFPKKAVLYGGIKYDLSANDIALASQKRGEFIDSLQRAGISFLKQTELEVQNISTTLSKGGLEQVKVFTGKQANEESFKSLSGGNYDIIHIATHGFYWEDSISTKKQYFANKTIQPTRNGRLVNQISPMDRSGLLFAGASLAMLGGENQLKSEVQNGVLTASEIASMDLTGTELVVLSACESGLGQVTEDGVSGLQKAFKIAGAKSIIMSLWDVEDEPTQIFMNQFYHNWIEEKQSRHEAFYHAQKYIKNKYPNPRIWMSFIMLD